MRGSSPGLGQLLTSPPVAGSWQQKDFRPETSEEEHFPLVMRQKELLESQLSGKGTAALAQGPSDFCCFGNPCKQGLPGPAQSYCFHRSGGVGGAGMEREA